MKTMATITGLAIVLSLGAAASAQQQTFTVNPGASNIGFALTGTGHEVHGIFHVISGTIQFDHNVPKMSGTILVSASSGDSGDKSRDKNMNQKVLQSDRFAEITFEPQSYAGTLAPSGDSTIQVSGTFTLHGTPHDITVPMQMHVEGQNLTAKGTFIVPYVKWGLKDPSMFVLKVAKEVHVELTLVGSVSPAT
jgi:polyisoprenoid-binding protein YceI